MGQTVLVCKMDKASCYLDSKHIILPKNETHENYRGKIVEMFYSYSEFFVMNYFVRKQSYEYVNTLARTHTLRMSAICNN